MDESEWKAEAFVYIYGVFSKCFESQYESV